MKREFIGYYNPTEKEINDSWNNGIFVFDANTLLNLYRYTESTRTDFLNALKTIKNRLFLPHQAALEYHTNRLAVIEGIEASYTKIKEILKTNFEDHLRPQVNQFKKHPAIKIDKILKMQSDFLLKIERELDYEKTNHPDFKSNDKVLVELTSLFDGLVGNEYSKEELKKIYEEGKERYADSVPPGYKDLDAKKKKGNRFIYGDLIIWKEVIDYTKKEKRPIIFITDDRKEDWWTIENGKTIRPREELIKEFFDLTGIRILIYNADNFLLYAKEKFVPTLNDKTIKEVKEIRVSDEKSNASFNELINTLDQQAKSISELINESEHTKKLASMWANYAIYRPKTLHDFLYEDEHQKKIREALEERQNISNFINDIIRSKQSKTKENETDKTNSQNGSVEPDGSKNDQDKRDNDMKTDGPNDDESPVPVS